MENSDSSLTISPFIAEVVGKLYLQLELNNRQLTQMKKELTEIKQQLDQPKEE